MSNQTQNKKALPKISLCMIVKNEEEMLPKCLSSVKHFVDEIIVVDTGSTDRTVDIAQSYGAKVYHHPWEDDFSKHRNQSISYAAGDWIFIMDADEALRPGDGVKIREAISHPEIDSVMVVVVNFFNQGTSQSLFNQVRLFKRDPAIFYSGIVHNQLTGYQSTVACSAQIYHYGYDLGQERMQAKFVRTSSLLKKRIKQDPENFRHYHDLAVSYSMNRMFDEAVSAGIKAIELAKNTEKKGGVLILWTYFIVASSLLIQRDFQGAEKYALEALKRFPNHLDSHFILVMAYHGLKDWARVKEVSDDYFNLLKAVQEHPGRFGYIVNNTTGEAWRVHLVLGDYYLEQGDVHRCKEAFDHAFSGAPVAFECLKIIADSYKNRSLWKEAAYYYQQAFKEKGDFLGALLGLALAKNRLGKKREAIQYYERALELEPDSIEALVNLGDLYCEQGEEDLAQKFYEKALGIESKLVNVSLRLANFSVQNGELEKCVSYCENILESLGLSFNRPLESVSDLADLFLIIGHELDKSGRDDLFREAMKVALNLKPELIA